VQIARVRMRRQEAIGRTLRASLAYTWRRA
jgi:hypothetical protein